MTVQFLSQRKHFGGYEELKDRGRRKKNTKKQYKIKGLVGKICVHE
jgi:hypothetical protein